MRGEERFLPGQAASTDLSLLTGCMIGAVRTALLELALDLELPDILHRTGTLEGIAARLGNPHTGNLAHILDAMAALGLAVKKKGIYANSPLAEKYLRTESVACLGPLLRRLKAMQHRNIGRMRELLYSGPRSVKDGDRLDGKELWKTSGRDMIAYQKSEVSRVLADMAASLPEFPCFRRMLDLGCGPGIIGLSIMARAEALCGAFCDLPPVLELAREEARAAGMEDRAAFYPGDYNQIDFGRGYDCVWAIQSLYFVKDLPAFLKKLLDALNPGGVFVSLHEGLHRERTAPKDVVLSRLSLALEGQDVSFEEGRIARLALEAGFASLERRTVTMLFGENEVAILRKAGTLERFHRENGTALADA